MTSFSGTDILCLATHEWDGHWTTVQQVMRRLAPEHRILYFEPFHPPLAWLLPRHGLSRQQRRERAARLREVQENLFVYRPGGPYLPWNMRSRAAAAVNAPIYRAEIRSTLAKLGFQKPWLWAFMAQSPSVLDLDFGRLVYDCIDEWQAYMENPRDKRFVAGIDTLLCKRADLVFASSEPLLKTKSALNPNTYVVNHAADTAHFMKAADAETEIPADLQAIPRPRIGYVGMVDRIRFDFDIVRRLTERADLHVVIVGGFAANAMELLPKGANVHVLGMQPLSRLPAYLKGLDVCLMPYALNEATRNIYPLKLHEYLATGKPVVATRIPAVEKFSELIYIVDRAENFLTAVDQALGERDPDLFQRRRACAGENSWEAHVKRKTDIIQQRLA